MRNLQTTLVAAVAAIVISIAATASAQETHPGYATVVRVQGIASYSLGDGQIHPLLAGKTLPAGATIYTGENGIVDVVLGKSLDFQQPIKSPDRISPAPDAAVRGYVGYTPSAQQNVIRLVSGTTLSVDKLNATDTGADTIGDTELNLQKGSIFFKVKKLSPTTEYLVKIPNGVAGIRGTAGSISANGVVAVFESTSSGVVVSISINGAGPQTFLVAPGQVFDPAGNGVTGLPSSTLSTLSGVFSELATVFSSTTAVTVSINQNCINISSTH